MLSIFCFCVTDSSPVMADKKWASVYLVRVHKLRNAQSTYPVVNHAQESISIGSGYNWCFFRVKRRILLFWLSMLSKTLPWKLIIFIYIFFTLFFGFFIHSLGTGNRSWVCSQIWFAKKKVPTNHKNSSTMTLIYSSTLMSNPLDSRKTKLL